MQHVIRDLDRGGAVWHHIKQTMRFKVYQTIVPERLQVNGQKVQSRCLLTISAADEIATRENSSNSSKNPFISHHVAKQ